ncbi:MAG: hypothetical protein M1837_005227 [Sclerophora amabilis]|nr:MAG: hypothetical protein M1837_005227 [Sclerophora amabilis]
MRRPVQLLIMSDLHLETPLARPTYEEFDILPSQCPYLALLGDIGHVSDARLFTFLTRQLDKFEIVFFLLGNHEPYGMSIDAARASVRAFKDLTDQQRQGASPESSGAGKFVFLDQTRYDLSNQVTVLGCTLFSRILHEQRPSVSLFASDFSNIQDWSIDRHCAAHEADVAWLNDQVAQIGRDEPDRSILVLTHHSPTWLDAANDPKHIKDTAQVRSAFATDMSDKVCWTSAQVRLWAFGHTHFNCDLQDPQTGKRLVTNQKGYRRTELMTFSPEKTVTVGLDVPMATRSSKRGRPRKDSSSRRKRCVVL